MKKQLPLALSTLILSSVTALSLFGCGGTANDPKTLNVIVLNAGYGDQWIKNIQADWESANPDYKINLTASYEAKSLIQKHIASKNNNDDLYISVGADWKSYAAQGYFAELDDFINEESEGKTIKTRVNSEYQKSLSFTGKDGNNHTYRLPWIAGIGGIYYNAQMFADNGWDAWLKATYPTNTTGEPETYDQLIALMGKINSDKVPVDNDLTATVKPFVYTGQNTDYFDYAVYTWWSQLAGTESIETFLKYEDPTVYDASVKGSAYSYLKEATGLWDGIFNNPNNYVEGSSSKSNHQAQQNFLNGYSAMMFDGEWLYNEMLKYTSSGTLPDSFKLKIMKTPTAPNASYPNASYIVGEDQFMAIPESSTKKDLAKSFLKSVISEKGCRTFLNDGHGMMAYDFDATGIHEDNTFISSVVSYKKNTTSTFTNFSSNLMYLSNIIDVWGTSAMRPFQGMLSNTATLDSSFETIASETTRQWDTWKKQAGIK